ncbi:RNA methyltransferase [Candidatus Bipolaricaulota bacterium]|nr:RNA methyltransferase [Candidatus Bipolaricaulota bacterium]
MKEIVTSTSNPRIIEARKLTQKKHRLRQNRFAAAGLQILGMALEGIASQRMAGRIHPLDVFYCEELFTTDTAPSILAGLTAAGATATHVSQRVLETLSDRELSQGLVATFAIDSLLHSLDETQASDSNDPRLIIILDRPQYPGNAGTLIRTADAVGAECVIFIEPAVDAFAPASVRASMGSIFAIPTIRTDDISAIGVWAERAKLSLVGADAADGDVVWESNAMSGSIGLVLGNEGEGLQPDLQALLTASVTLPQRGNAESLNVSIAGGILMYEWMRVNQSALF